GFETVSTNPCGRLGVRSHMDSSSLIVAWPWRPIVTPLFPWVRSIEKIIRAIQVPAITGPNVYIASDYSGEAKSHLYDVLSILYLDVQQSSEWAERRRLVRTQYMADGRRMSFKALNDRQRQGALVPFLRAANAIHGVLISIAVRKSITNLCTSED